MKKTWKRLLIVGIILSVGIIAFLFIFNENDFNSAKRYAQVKVNKVTLGKYSEAQKIIKEVMRDYYIKGSRMQYNFAKTKYGEESPEDATSQSVLHSVCAAYIYDVYREAFGVENKGKYLYEFPRFNTEVLSNARQFYQCDYDSNFSYGFDCTKRDGNFLIYYQNTNDIKYSYTSTDPSKKDKDGNYPKIIKTITSREKYIYDNKTVNKNSLDDFDYFVSLIKPGDIFTYTGHVLIAYETVERTAADGTKFKDVLILNSTQAPLIYTRIRGTTQLSNNLYKATTNNVIDNDDEGTLKYKWFSNLTEFVKTTTETKNGKTITKRTVECSKDECVLIRPFYEDKNGNAVFNYEISEENYKRSTLRADDYPGLDIDKIVDKRDKNNVYLNDTMEYSIKITNKSNTTYNGKTYAPFYIEETLDSKVKFVSSTIDNVKTTSSTLKQSDNKLTWTINKKIAPGDSVTIKYKVKVNNDTSSINKKIISTGRFYKNNETSIRLAQVENLIVTNKINEVKKDYQKCFDENKSKYSGLTLVNKVYSCATGKDYSFDKFKFESVFSRKPYYYVSETTNKKTYYASTTDNAIAIKSSDKIDSDNLPFKNMILNNYWSGTYYNASTNKDGKQVIHMMLPKWNGSSANKRAKNIYASDFKDGDILIYYIKYTDDDCNGIPGSATWQPEKGACSEVYNVRYTTEDGLYAFIYINGTFKGINGTGTAKRDDFTYEYYNTTDAKGKTTNKMYKTGYSKLVSLTGGSNTDRFKEVMTYNNLQTLYDKDYYVILRPTLINEYAVNYDSNGGTGSMNSTSMEYEKSYNLTTNTFKKTGYTFAGWNTKADGKGTSYADKVSVKNLNLMNGMSVTLYATWKANTYSIKYNANGGTGTMSNQSMTYGTGKKLTANAFKKTGYVFAGWNTKADGSGTKYTNAQTVSNLTSTNNGTVTLYAQWTVATYKISYELNGGTQAKSGVPASYKYGTGATINGTPTKTGYTFNGWQLGTSKGLTYTITKTDLGDKTISALWCRNCDNVSNGSCSLNAKTAGTCTYTTKCNTGYAITNNGKYNPTCTAYKYTVKYNANGGTGIMSDQGMTYGTSYTLTANSFERTGYKFAGWNTKSNGEGKKYIDSQKISNLATKNNEVITLYAQWKKDAVPGDASGDGKINYLDYVAVYNHIEKQKNPSSTKKLLDGEKLKSADMNGDNKVNYLDYVAIYNKIKKSKG